MIELTLGHFAELTTKMRKELDSLSDFFGGWAKTKMEITKLGNNALAQLLLTKMAGRENVLSNNKMLNTAVFLDLGYQQFMPSRNKKKAIEFLSELHGNYDHLNRKLVMSIQRHRIQLNLTPL